MSSPRWLDRALTRVRPTRPDVVESGPPVTHRNRRAAIVAALAVLVLVLTAIGFYHWGAGTTPQALPTAKPTPTPTKLPSIADIYKAVSPSVVSIVATRAGAPTVTGTGVVVNADGTILTALHVVRGAGTITVTFGDGATSAATITAAAPTIDIATLGPATLPSIVVPAVLGRSDRLAVGDSVVAIGNQLGLTGTTTAGVVSGLDRLAPGPDGANLTGLIQFDAAVNSGSSGSPLVDNKGETVGIVVALANPTPAGTFIGVGFAMPITAAVAAGGGNRVPQQ